MRVEFCDECIVVLDERGRIDVEFAELIVKGENIASQGDWRGAEPGEWKGCAAYDAVRKLLACTITEDLSARLPAEPDPVLSEESRRKRVVGEHLRLSGELILIASVIHVGELSQRARFGSALRHETRTLDAAHARPHRCKQLRRSLRGEGESDDAIGRDHAAADEPSGPG